MTIGILGLGLIGGSMARAYSKAGHTVLACEKDESMLSFSQLAGVVNGVLQSSSIGQCHLIILAVNPLDCGEWLKKNASYITRGTIVLDLCGTKTQICRMCFPIAEEYGFTFVGGHPMAGSHLSGFKYSRSNLFQGAPMVLVPPDFDSPELLEQVVKLLSPCKFGSFSVTTAEEHDRLIAFTSQIPHIVSNAYIKSPTASDHKGYSAGSYKDLTRVAWLNSKMWAELLMENRKNALWELDTFINNLTAYRNALQQQNMKELVSLLEVGKKCKEAVDG